MAIPLPNPLRPLSYAFVARAIIVAPLALWMLLSHAMAISRASAGGMAVGALALVLLGIAALDGFRAFSTLARLTVEELGISCDGAHVCDLLQKEANPNLEYLSRLGRWCVRVSDPFASLPVPYQRLTEVAVTAIAFAVTSAVVFALLAAFGSAAGKGEITMSLLGWMWDVFVALAYAFWLAMLGNFFTAAHWARKLTVRSLLRIIAAGIVLVAGASFVVISPTIYDQSVILILGSLAVVSVIFVLAFLRASVSSPHFKCSRIVVSDTVATHPQGVLAAFTSVLPTGHGTYQLLGDKAPRFVEHGEGLRAGMFNTEFAGEYSIQLSRVGASDALRSVASAVGIAGIALGGLGLTMIAAIALDITDTPWGAAFGLLLFGELLLLAAFYPLSEIVFTSYLLGARIDGNFRQHGGADQAGLHTSYTADGGLALATSVGFVQTAVAFCDVARTPVSTAEDDAERAGALGTVNSHLAQAAPRRAS
jgi:hypothetical protein